MKLYRHVSAVMAALVLTGLSYSAGATDINVSSDKAEELLGLTTGSPVQTAPEVKHITDTLTVNVHGKSLTDAGKSKNVTGIYNGFGSQLTVDKDLVVRLKNDAPASKRELGHYYMSAVMLVTVGRCHVLARIIRTEILGIPIFTLKVM